MNNAVSSKPPQTNKHQTQGVKAPTKSIAKEIDQNIIKTQFSIIKTNNSSFKIKLNSVFSIKNIHQKLYFKPTLVLGCKPLPDVFTEEVTSKIALSFLYSSSATNKLVLVK